MNDEQVKGLLYEALQTEIGGQQISDVHLEVHAEAAPVPALVVEHAVQLTKPPAGAAVYGVIGAPSRAGAPAGLARRRSPRRAARSPVRRPGPTAPCAGGSA